MVIYEVGPYRTSVHTVHGNPCLFLVVSWEVGSVTSRGRARKKEWWATTRKSSKWQFWLTSLDEAFEQAFSWTDKRGERWLRGIGRGQDWLARRFSQREDAVCKARAVIIEQTGLVVRS